MKKKTPITNEHLAKAITDLGETISDLGEGVGERFDKVDQRFDGVDQRFDKVDQRFDSMDRKIDESRETLARAIKDLDLRFTANTSMWAKDFATLHAWVKDIDERLSALEMPRRRSR